MMRAARLRSCALALALLVPTPALAEEPLRKPEARALALEKAQQGLTHYDAGRWQDAYDSFREAAGLYDAPSVEIYLARCQRKLGRPAEARALYERILAEPLARDAPPQFVEAHRDAERELDAIRREPAARPSAPAGPVSPPPVSAPPVPPPADHTAGPLWPGLVTLGVGAAGLGIGAVTGLISLSKVSDLSAHCGGYHCTPSDEPAAASARGLGNASTAAFVVGGAAAAAGVLLLVIRPGGRPLTAPQGTSKAAWSAGVGVGRIDLEVRF
jgi:tetratricopeptide (TPR) repeat protein